MASLPDFDSLPKVDGKPTAAGLWDTADSSAGGSHKDVLGTLNLLTPSIISAACAEATQGISVSLNWTLDAIRIPGFGRKKLVHKVISFQQFGFHGYDDELEFNTQASSQWDSLLHFHHQPSGTGYNGTQTSVAELERGSDAGAGGPRLPTLEHWHSRGGMVARGVLIDFKKYADETGRAFNPYDADKISVQDIETVARRQGVDFRIGDVLIIRSGYTEGLTGVSPEKQEQLMGGRSCGVEGSEETARWVWNKHFAAVAGDMVAFEHFPPVVDGKEGGSRELVLHQYFLGLFGMCIGELWDLKKLAETCERLNRYSFLLTSTPMNVAGLVGSPPNALAIF